MDKNQIHIDEVVRQRLAGAEEDRKPGAWFTMREVLDKAMPVGGAAVSAFNWRRMLSYTGVLLVAATATFGGYKVYEQSKNGIENQQLSAGTPSASGPAAILTTAQSAENAPAFSVVPQENAVGNTGSAQVNTAFEPGNPSNRNTVASSTDAVNSAGILQTSSSAADGHKMTSSRTNNGHPRSAGTATDPSTATNSIGNSSVSTTRKTPTARNNGPRVDAAGKPSRTAVTGRSTPADPAGSVHAKNAGQSRADAIAKGSKTGTAHGGDASSTPATGRVTNNSASTNRRSNRRSAVTPGRAVTGTLAAGGAASANPSRSRMRREIRNDTLHIIELDRRKNARAAGGRVDTISERMIVVPKVIDVPVLDDAQVYKTNPRYNPAGRKMSASASANAVASASSLVVPASSLSTAGSENRTVANESKKGSTTSIWERLNMQSAIDRTRSAFAQVEYRGGFAGGFNTTVSGTSLFGFQLGLMGIAFLTGDWSIMAELKYFQRVNRGGAFSDDYVRRTPAGNGNVWEDSVNHFFNYSTLQTIEIPIMARYVKGSWYGLAGINLSQTLQVNTEEVTHQHNNPALQQGHMLSAAARQSADINDSDFDPRFGAGYVVGVGFQFSPAFGVDARVAQIIWDNVKSSGGARVSKELYKMPSVQLTFGYRFGSK